MEQLTADEIRILRLCADSELHIGSGSEEEWSAFLALEARGLIVKSEADGGGYFWPTPLGEQALLQSA